MSASRQARRIAPEKMSLQLADILYKMYFMERNIKLLVDYSSSWPVLSFPAYAIPEILYIWLLSEKLEISSPVPKLPFVDPGLGYEQQHFGWSGSVGFSTAAMLPKKLPSKEPNNIAASAVQHVLYEIEESVSMSTSLDNVDLAVEVICIDRIWKSNGPLTTEKKQQLIVDSLVTVFAQVDFTIHFY